jgi:hypothetical protein
MLLVPEGLLGSRGDLLGYIRSGKDDLCVGNAVVFDEHDLDHAVDGIVVVDDVGHGVDQFDREFCVDVACCRLGAEYEGALVHFKVRGPPSGSCTDTSHA